MTDRGAESMSLATDASGNLTFGPFSFDETNGILSDNGSEISLAPRPLAVLRLLLERRGDVVPKQEILDIVWSDAVVEEATLSEAIKVLRRALGDNPRKPVYIQTLHRRGYRFIAEVSTEAAAHPTRSESGTPDDAETAPESRSGFTTWALIAAAVVIVALVGYVMWPVSDSRVIGDESLAENESSGSAIVPADGPVWILIADVQNETSQLGAGDGLERSLEQALAGSGFANVVPQHRIDETLRLMRRTPGSPIDPATSREISLRDGEIRAVFTGRLQRIESGHLVTVEIVEPSEGVAVAAVTQELAAGDDVAGSVVAVADRAVASLREHLPALPVIPEDARLEPVTTASLRALQFYMRAGGLDPQGGPSGRWHPEIYEDAVREDPDFASAHIMLAWAIENTGGQPEEYLAHAERAVALAEDVTDAEEYWIRGSSERFRSNYDGAIEHYKTLLRVDPDHPWVLTNLRTYLSEYTPRFEEAVEYQAMLGDRANGSLTRYANAAGSIAVWGNDPERAEPYARRGLELLEADDSLWWHNNPHAIWLQFYPVHQRWIAGDVAGAREELDRMAEALTSAAAASEWPRERVSSMARGLRDFYLALGMLAAAEAVNEFDPSGYSRQRFATLVAVARAGEGNLDDDLQIHPTAGQIADHAVAVTLNLREGRLSEARAHLASLDEKWVEVSNDSRQRVQPYVAIARDALALAEGGPEATGRDGFWVGRAVRDLRPTGGISYFRGAETLASIREAEGNLDESRRVLQDAFNQRARSHTWYPGDQTWYLQFAQSEWVRVAWNLAVTNRKLGRLAEARMIEDELRALLVYADEDMWIVQQLRGLEEAGGSTDSR